MELTESFEWRGRTVRWGRAGSGPDLVFCHGTPWSSRLWSPYADALSGEFTTYLWDMPGYGESSKDAGHEVSLAVQGELFADLLAFWGLANPHVVAHDYGGTVSLRARLLHRATYASLALIDVVALAPWGSESFRHIGEHAEVFAALPPDLHEALVRKYIGGASHTGLSPAESDLLATPWLDAIGQAAFYRQIAEADRAYTDEVEPLYPRLDLPVLVVWGTDDTWIPVDRAHRLAKLIPGAQLDLIDGAGHLIQLDQPTRLATALHRWLTDQLAARVE